jgi:hypothetical protein
MALEDVRTKGYAVVPGFLAEPEMELLAGEFEKLREGARPNPNFNTRFLPRKHLAPFNDKVVAAAKLASPPPLIMDRLRIGIFYATKIAWQWDWHTDTTSHYMHPRYLNFWIPLRKPDRRRSGLCVVGFDALTAHCPDLARELLDHGSTRVVIRDGRTVFHDTARRKVFEIASPTIMDQLAVAPELGPGDALILRNDVFHRTQDNETERLAISFRVNPSNTVVTRQALMDMGSAKFNNMARMRGAFARRFAAFEIARRDTLAAVEYDDIVDELEARERRLCQKLKVQALEDGQFQNLVYDLAQEYTRRDRRDEPPPVSPA